MSFCGVQIIWFKLPGPGPGMLSMKDRKGWASLCMLSLSWQIFSTLGIVKFPGCIFFVQPTHFLHESNRPLQASWRDVNSDNRSGSSIRFGHLFVGGEGFPPIRTQPKAPFQWNIRIGLDRMWSDMKSAWDSRHTSLQFLCSRHSGTIYGSFPFQ